MSWHPCHRIHGVWFRLILQQRRVSEKEPDTIYKKVLPSRRLFKYFQKGWIAGEGAIDVGVTQAHHLPELTEVFRSRILKAWASRMETTDEVVGAYELAHARK